LPDGQVSNPEALGASIDLNLAHQCPHYLPEPVDVTGVPDELVGFRTLFSAFHHFRPEQARAILGDAVRKHQGIAIFEGTYHSALAMFLMLLVPLMVLLVTLSSVPSAGRVCCGRTWSRWYLWFRYSMVWFHACGLTASRSYAI